MGTEPLRRTRLAVAVVAVGAAVAGAAFAAGGGGAAPSPLLPDLDPATPYSLSVQKREGRYVLAFASAAENLGRGPLWITAVRPGAARAMDATQLIRRTDGSVVRRPLGRIVHYEHAETHSHWHLHRFARYELRRAPDGALALQAIKQGFCLGDRYDVARADRRPGEPARARWTHECGRGETGLRRLDEGISPGYGDDYLPYLEGQHFPLRGLREGRYVLVHRLNAWGALREADAGNNASSVLLELRRPAGRSPRVVVLARCPDSARCGS